MDSTFLEEQRQKPKEPFLARAPEWADVVHGEDDDLKFLERDQLSDLRRELLTQLVERMERGTSGLHILSVVGPPGEGKSTLVRGVAAQLVEERRVVVADAGANLFAMPTSVDDYAERLSELADAGRPVLLLLDDPFFDDSEWPGLLQKLAARPGGRIAALTASPEFLYSRYEARLRGPIHKHRFDVRPPTKQERDRFAQLYGRDPTQWRATEGDFLVMAMEAAAGIPFDSIVDRLWITLNDGKPFPPEGDLSQLPWTVRALLLVSFFHRGYVACPESLLHAALVESGGTGASGSVTTALSQLKNAEGWCVFRLSSKKKRAYLG